MGAMTGRAAFPSHGLRSRNRLTATVSPNAGTQPSYGVLYEIKGGLRPPAGCARLAPLAVLAAQHQEHGVEENSVRDDELPTELE